MRHLTQHVENMQERNKIPTVNNWNKDVGLAHKQIIMTIFLFV